MKLAISKIHGSPEPIRKTWDEEKLQELTQSIQEQGLIVPIKVRPNSDGYEIVYGHRRFEAAKRAGLVEIEAFVEGLDDTNTLVQALIENVQREDMAALDKAKAVRAIKEQTGWSNGELQRQGIIAGEYAGRLLALLNEPIEVQQRVDQIYPGGKMDEFTVTTIRRTGLDNEDKIQVLDKVGKEGLNREQARKVAESVKSAPTPEAKKRLLEWEYSPTIHDPELIKSRSERFGAHDPLYQDDARKSTQKQWEQAPEVKIVIDGVIEAAKAWTMLISEIRKMVEVGKMSPEGRQFTATKLRSLSERLSEFADELEQEVEHA